MTHITEPAPLGDRNQADLTPKMEKVSMALIRSVASKPCRPRRALLRDEA